MNRREFLVACGMPGVCEANWFKLAAETYVTNVSYHDPGLPEFKGPQAEVGSEGKWWVERRGGSIIIKLYAERLYFEIRIEDFKPSTDYVRAFTMRDKPSPLYDEMVNLLMTR